MTDTVLHIGGTIEQAGKVLSRDGDVLTVELDDGRVITRHEKNFAAVSAFVQAVEEAMPQVAATVADVVRKRGRPKKSTAG